MNLNQWNVEVFKICKECKGIGSFERPDATSFITKLEECKECAGKGRITDRVSLVQLKEILGAK